MFLMESQENSTPISDNPTDVDRDIRLVALDLDGTLLSDDKQVSMHTINALRLLPQRGVRVVIASARPPRSVRPIYQLLNLNTFQINYNGALVWDEQTGKSVYHRPLSAEVVTEIVDFARDMFEEVCVSCEVLDRWFTDRMDDVYTTETGKLYKPDLIAPLSEFLNQPVTKLLLLGEERMLLKLEGLLIDKYADEITIVKTDENLLQIMNSRVGKGLALKKVCKHYGVSMKNVMAMGDAPNDVGMLKVAGVAIAMGNAHPLVKQQAHWVAPSNNDHGVHAALVRYGLSE
jgi:5-amino-6-(5-phospho-D-ribitylamino)uracil phosphatase